MENMVTKVLEQSGLQVSNVRRRYPSTVNSWQYNTVLLVFYGLIAFEIGTVFFMDYGIDAGVYRLGGAMVSGAEGRHSPLYGEWEWREGDPRLPFTYPPFAAILFVPLAFLPQRFVSLGFMFATTAIAVFVAGRMVVILEDNAMVPPVVKRFLLSKDGRKRQQYPQTLVLCLSIIIIVFSNAWLGTINFSQINAILLWAVVWDVVLPHKYSKSLRGIVLGVVGGIKLTPLAFGLLFLVRRDWRSIMRMGAGFIGSIGFSWIVLPQESQQFWMDIILDSSRPGDHAFISNLSLRGMLEHAGVPADIMVPIWLASCFFTIVAGAAAMARLVARNMGWSAVGVNSIVMLLISPISWGHHWVWNVIFIVCFATTIEVSYREGILSRTGVRIQRGILGCAVVFFALNPLTFGYIFGLGESGTTGASAALLLASSGVFFAGYIVCYWALAKLPETIETRPGRNKALKSGGSY